MQRQFKSKIYKKFLICSLIIFITGLLLAFTSLFSLYGDVNKCGFGANTTCPNANTHAAVAEIGGVTMFIGFGAGLIFTILFVTARSRESRSSE